MATTMPLSQLADPPSNQTIQTSTRTTNRTVSPTMLAVALTFLNATVLTGLITFGAPTIYAYDAVIVTQIAITALYAAYTLRLK